MFDVGQGDVHRGLDMAKDTEKTTQRESESDLLSEGAQIHRSNVFRKIGISGGGAVLLLIVVVVSFVLFSGDKDTGPQTVPGESAFEQTGDVTQRADTWVVDVPRSDVLIRMNDGKYVPDNITVGVGMTIAFVNEDEDQEYWPISTSHPELFDVSSAMPPGSFWSFTAIKPERYEFSDQLHPNVSGVIRPRELQE